MGKKKLFSNKKKYKQKKINSVQLLVITALALKVYCFGKSPREPFLTSSVLPGSGAGGSRGCGRGPGSLPPGPSRCFRAGAAGKSLQLLAAASAAAPLSPPSAAERLRIPATFPSGRSPEPGARRRRGRGAPGAAGRLDGVAPTVSTGPGLPAGVQGPGVGTGLLAGGDMGDLVAC